MKNVLKFCFALAIFFLFSLSFSSSAHALLGSSCNAVIPCAPSAACQNNICKGPCANDAQCEAAGFLGAIGWGNATCVGEPGGFCAEAVGIGKALPTGITSAQGFLGLMTNVVNWIFAFLMLAAILFIMLAGFQFVTSGGDASAVNQERSKLLWAAVGIGVALLSQGIKAIIIALTGG